MITQNFKMATGSLEKILMGIGNFMDEGLNTGINFGVYGLLTIFAKSAYFFGVLDENYDMRKILKINP